MPAPDILLVSDLGDPAHPRTWSGTTNNLLQSLRATGCSVETLNLMPKRPLRAAMAALSLATGHGREYRRTRLATLYSSFAMRRALRPETIVLHTTGSTVPQPHKRNGIRHALYMDCTFHIMSKYTISRMSDTVRQNCERFEAGVISSADHLFTVSECAAQDIVDHYGISPDRVTVAGTGIGGKLRSTEGPRDYSNRTLLFVGKERFEEKGGHLLLDAFRLAYAQDPTLKLVVVAQDEHRQAVEAVPGTTFHSFLPWDELEALFNTASLFVMPAFFEPWGLVYVEALSCRTPILGLARTALPELACHGECGFLVQEPTPQAVAAAILEALSDPGLLARMGARGQQHVRDRYSWVKVAERIRNALYGPAAA